MENLSIIMGIMLGIVIFFINRSGGDNTKN